MWRAELRLGQLRLSSWATSAPLLHDLEPQDDLAHLSLLHDSAAHGLIDESESCRAIDRR